MHKEKRKIIIIDKIFQMKYFFKIFIINILISFFLLSLFYWWNINYVKQILIGIEIYDNDMSAMIFKEAIPGIFYLLLLIIIMSLLFSASTLFISHKIAGPMFRLKKFMKMVETGSYNLNLTFREKDELKDIAISFNNMISSILKKEEAEIKIIKDFENRLNSLITESQNNTFQTTKCQDLRVEIEQFRRKKESYIEKRQI